MSSQVVLKYVEKKKQAGSCDAAAKEKKVLNVSPYFASNVK